MVAAVAIRRALVALTVVAHAAYGFQFACVGGRSQLRAFAQQPRAHALLGEPASILAQVNAQVKDAMKAKEVAKLTALRNIKAALLLAMKEEAGAEDLSDAKAQPILRKLAKMRRESMDMFAQAPGGGADRIAEEAFELEIIEGFLPQLADEATTRTWIAEVRAASPDADMGRVMGALMKAHRADLDGKLAQKLLKELMG
jgi:hypothetical protein